MSCVTIGRLRWARLYDCATRVNGPRRIKMDCAGVLDVDAHRARVKLKALNLPRTIRGSVDVIMTGETRRGGDRSGMLGRRRP